MYFRVLRCGAGDVALLGTGLIVITILYYSQLQRKGDDPIEVLDVNTSSLKSLKREGIVYNCLTGDVIKTYSAAEVETKLGPIRRENLTQTTGESAVSIQSSFENIYTNQIWGAGKHTGDNTILHKASGPGSALYNSQTIIALLHTFIMQLKFILKKERIKILDLPCGDHQYMNHFLRTRDDIDYTGMDIVPELITLHRRRYKKSPNIHFRHLDIVNSHLNETYDLIICRMMLQHLTNQEVLRALRHFSDTGSGYFAATTFSAIKTNSQLNPKQIGRYRPLNLEARPIKLEPPVCLVRESILNDQSHYIGVWKLPLRQFK